MQSRWRVAVVLTLRVLLAAVFMVSAVAKLFAIDSFELYVFSYGFFPLGVAFVLARLCIAAEFLLGLFIALGWHRRLVNVFTFCMLVFFSLFLCYAALVGRNESCQCFGRLADLNPAQSLVKNAVLILLLLVYGRLQSAVRPNGGRGRVVPLLSCIFVVIVTAGIFVVSVPDSWMFGPERTRFDTELLDEAISPDGDLAEMHLDRGHHLLAFVTPGCPYCKMCREKLGSIAKRNHLDESLMHYVEPSDMVDDCFLRITYGQRPLVLLLEDGEVKVTYHYRNINEREITRFLRSGKQNIQ